MLGDLALVHRHDLREVQVANDAPREQVGRGLVDLAAPVAAVGEEAPRPGADPRPLGVGRGQEHDVGQVDLLDERPHGGEPLAQEADALGVDGLRAAGVQRRGHPAHEEGLRVRVLAAQDGVDADHVALPLERLQVVRDEQQVLLGRQPVGRVAPVAVAEERELAGVGQPLHARAHRAEVRRARLRPVRQRLSQARRARRAGLQRRDDVHPVERVQVVEVDDVVVDELAARDQVAHELRVGRRRGADRVLDGPHRRDGVHRRADAADPLGPDPGLAGVLALEDRLDPAEHRRRRPRLGDLAALHVGLDAQVALDAGDRVNLDVRHRRSPREQAAAADLLAAAGSSRASGGFAGRDAWACTIFAAPCATVAAATAPTTASPTVSAVVSAPKPGTLGSRW